MKESNFEYSPELYVLQVNWKQRLEKEKPFFEGIIATNNVKNILDIGCGTGHHAQLFSGMVPSVTAIDPYKDMIDFAAANIIKSGNVTLLNAGFEDFMEKVPGNFDMVTCLGNTLPLLGTRRAVKLALKNARKKLNKGGIAVFQFLNFEPGMIEKNRYYQPKSAKKDDKQYIFMKHFEYGKINTRADFIIIEIDREGNISNFYNRSSFFCTLRKNIFIKMAINSGYKKVELLGTNGEEEFDHKKHISLYAMLYN